MESVIFLCLGWGAPERVWKMLSAKWGVQIAGMIFQTRSSDIIPLCRSVIQPGRTFCVIGNSNEISYYIKNRAADFIVMAALFL